MATQTETTTKKPRTKKQSNLSLAKVKKTAKKMDETEIHIIETGEYKSEQITFHPTFSETKIEELFTEFGQLVNEAQEKGIEITQQMEIYIIQMLICKKFTHFDKDIKIEDGFSSFINVLEHFHKTGLMYEIMEIFDVVQVQKVYERMGDFTSKFILMEELQDKMIEKMSSMKLKNQVVFDQLAQINTDNTLADSE